PGPSPTTATANIQRAGARRGGTAATTVGSCAEGQLPASTAQATAAAIERTAASAAGAAGAAGAVTAPRPDRRARATRRAPT
ncbi:hypothetical protein AWC22_04480, partial [Mycobacterium riyadhense]